MRLLPLGVLILCCAATATFTQTCSAGANGADGANLTVTVHADFVTGCYTETFSDGAINTLVFCNGTSAATCPQPVVTTVGQAPGCAAITGQGSVLFCNASAVTGATGATGARGATGATGPALALTTTNQAAGCVAVAGTGAAVLCNGTSDSAGATGARGLQGAAGASGTNGTTGAVGARGPTGLLPSYFIVDGTTYPRNTAGINNAITAAVAAGGGTVYISGAPCVAPTACTPTPINIPLDCAAVIVIPPNVRLDLGGNTLQMPPNATVCNSFLRISNSLGSALTLQPSTALTQTAAEGANRVVVSPGAITTALMLAAADRTQDIVCNIQGGFFGLVNTGHQQYAVVTNADNTTGIITLRDPLSATFPSGTATVTCSSPWAGNQALVNGVLDANGNSGAGSYLLLMQHSMRALVSRITFKGAASSGNFAALWTSGILDCTFEHLVFDTVSGYTQESMRIQSTFSSHFSDLSVTNSALGLVYLLESDFNIFSDLRVAEVAGGVGLYIVTSSYNSFENVVVSGANDAVQFVTGSHHNTINGLLAGSATLRALNFIGAGDAYNQVWGLVAPNAAQIVVFNNVGGNSVGNYVEGELQPLVGAYMTSSAAGSTDPTFGNMARQTVNNNGFTAYAVHNTTVTAADFVDKRQLIISVVNDASLKINVLNSNNQVVSTTVSVL